jgi:hypothetical protein
MIVAKAGALDLYADLPEDADRYTNYTDRNPKVKISQRLAATRYHNRLPIYSRSRIRPRLVSRVKPFIAATACEGDRRATGRT